MKQKRLIFLATIIIAFYSCDEIDNPLVFSENEFRFDLYESYEFSEIEQTGKNVLVEDFTAHQCGNCPPAAVIAETLVSDFEGKVIALAIHAGNLAVTSDEYNRDWTCEEGDVFWSQLDFQANPIGRINRKVDSGDFYSPGQWSAIVTEELQEPTPLELQIHTDIVEYPDSTHLNIHVFGQYFSNDVVGENRLAILISESHLFGDQLDYSQDPEHIFNYEFNHMLRGSINGAEGLAVISNPNSGDTFQSDFTLTWDSNLDVSNSHIIAVVSDENGYIINCLSKDDLTD